MELRLTREEERFREEVREFLRTSLPPHIAGMQRQGYKLPRKVQQEWHRILYAKGWAAPEWPREYGGCDWTSTQRYLFEDEYAAADAPFCSTAGLHLVGPLLCHFGSDDLKRRFLTPTLNGDIHYGQGFSEPGAGSDLAHLKTRAVRDGDQYVVTGTKIWTGLAHESEWIFALVRTDPAAKAQAGISMILIDLAAPGVTIRPIITLDYCHHLNQVFFDDVRVPAGNLIGEENKAWTYAKFLLDNERTFNAMFGRLKRFVRKIREIADAEADATGESPLTPEFRRKFERLAIDVRAQEWSTLRVLCAGNDPSREIAAAASSLKVRGSELMMRASELELELAGLHAFALHPDPDGPLPDGPLPGDAPRYAPGLFAEHAYWRASRVYSGTNEIQRGIIWNTLYR